MEKVYDAVIVGGGPAGLLAARLLKEQGCSVALIEIKKSFSTLKRACSMQFILDDGYEGDFVQVRDGRIHFARAGFDVGYGGCLIPVRHKYYHSPHGSTISFGREDDEPFAYKFDKQKLLEGLYDECCSLGVDFLLNSIAYDGEDLGDRVLVRYRCDDRPCSVYGRKLIIAEGVNAALSQKFGLNEGRRHFATAVVGKYFVRGIKGIETNSWNLFYGRAFHSNAAVIIGPSIHGDDIKEITITGDRNNAPARVFSQVCEDSPISPLLKDIELVEKQGCFVKAFNSSRKPYKGNVIGIGDAAAFIEVEVQGAFLCAYYAARAVAMELRGEAGFEEYTRWWLDAFEFNSDEYLRVSQGYALVPVYSDDELDYLFGLLDGKWLDGTYSQYRTPKLIWDAIWEEEGRIGDERPEILEKMKKMNQMSLSSAIGK